MQCMYSSHVKCKTGITTTASWGTSPLLLKSTHSSEWVSSDSTPSSHETLKATIVTASHLLTHENFKYLIWVKGHSTSASSWHSSHSSHVEMHSSWHTAEAATTHSILHIVHTKSPM